MVSEARLRIVFFGTPEFALPTLDTLLASRHPVVGIVTQPDRARGRGQKLSTVPVKARGLTVGVAVIQPERLKAPSFVQSLKELRPDLGVVAAYGKILTDEVLAIPRFGLVNVHASLLPRYRGAAPVHRAIINGETVTGVTIMRVVKALDAGPMLAAKSRAIAIDETSEEVERALARLGATLLLETVDQVAAGTAVETFQDEAAATYAPRLIKDEGAVDWTMPGDRIHNLIRGLQPWPHAFTFLNGRRIILLRATFSNGSPSRMPGTIVEAHGDRLTVASGRGLIHLMELQVEGKRAVKSREFLAGHRVAVGDRLEHRS
jgi:methionyl-tRNA formyltransferase